MNKLKALILLSALCAFSACGIKDQAEDLVEDSENLLNDVTQSYNNVVDKVVETKEDIDTAIKEVEEAKEAIDAISE